MYNSFIDVLKKGYVTIQLYMYNFIGLLTATERKKTNYKKHYNTVYLLYRHLIIYIIHKKN